MTFSLIVCTYKRPQPLLNLLNSVKTQSLYPNEILIIDGSIDNETKTMVSQNQFDNLKYYKVDDSDRGLTRQRNFGIQYIGNDIEIACFLDDDIVLKEDYFSELLSTYTIMPEAIAVGGYILDEADWSKETSNAKSSDNFYFDDWVRTEPLRFKIRNLFNLGPDTDPGFLPTFSHGRSIGFLPPSGKIYQTEQLMGGVSSYKTEVFKKIKFSEYFEGYGLYEDADFSLRLSKIGKLYVNTNAQLYHYHDHSGRPNKFKYGKMVVRNGWYVWRVKYPNPTIKAKLKWNLTAFLLTLIRFTNVINSKNRIEAFTESLGRIVGWISLVFSKPKIQP